MSATLPDRSLFLPVSRQDMLERGWDQVDFAYVVGDAYIDHSSFGMAIVSRMLEARGFRVGIICQPDWTDPSSVCEFGRPRLGFLVSSGNMDSMVNHYTVARKHRGTDAYSPGGRMGLRPDRALAVYGNLIRRAYRDVPIIAGGIEASLRRFAHYDYWSDSMRRSVLLDSAADLLIYGMGEHQIVEVAEALDAGLSIHDITFIDGTVYRAKSLEHVYDAVVLPSWDDVRAQGDAYARSFAVQYRNTDPFTGKRLVEPYGEHEFVVQNPPSAPLDAEELDAVYRLPYARAWHPDYAEAGGVPALSEVKFSLTSNRGCFGECAFCALTFHQGRILQARSRESLVEEARLLTEDPDFKGYIHDVGGPTANFRAPACGKQLKSGACTNKRCLSPKPCARLVADHSDYLALLRELRDIPGVKKVFVRSGIRFDYVMEDQDFGQEFLDELVRHHVSGQLRVAPEHVSDAVLAVMGKPPHQVYERFAQAFRESTEAAGKEQYVVPYLMSSHPEAALPRPWSWRSTAATWASTPSRCRISTPRPPRWPRSCTPPGWTRAPWSRSTWRSPPTRRRCSGRSSSTATPRTATWWRRPCAGPAGPTSSASARSASSARSVRAAARGRARRARVASGRMARRRGRGRRRRPADPNGRMAPHRRRGSSAALRRGVAPTASAASAGKALRRPRPSPCRQRGRPVARSPLAPTDTRAASDRGCRASASVRALLPWLRGSPPWSTKVIL